VSVRTTQSTPVTLPPAAPVVVPATSVEPEDTMVATPEPPKEVTYEEAGTAFHARRYKETVELFTIYTERKSENPWGYFMLGLSHWKAGDNDSAEIAFEQALALDPKHVKSYINLARVLLDADRPAEAMTKIDEALTLDPESQVAYRLQGRAFHELDKSDEAIAAYRDAILIDSNDAWSMNNLGLLLIEQERFDEALRPLARAVELQSDVAVFFNNLGMALEHQGQFRAAEEAYESAIAADSSNDKAVTNLDRVSIVREDRGLPSIDLEMLAQSFVDEIASWREELVSSAPDSAETVITSEPDTTGTETLPIVVSEADSTGGRQR
jgi:Tfp pilus assembly protein PilF